MPGHYSLLSDVSRVFSDLLNLMTNAEVESAAFGNDANGEVAMLHPSPSRLPTALADYVTRYSNVVGSSSFDKFHRTIGLLALAEPKHTADSAITTYFS